MQILRNRSNRISRTFFIARISSALPVGATENWSSRDKNLKEKKKKRKKNEIWGASEVEGR